MNILLVNSNPVVSRLFALCTRDESIVLDEIEMINMLEKKRKYSLAFVDDASCTSSVQEFMEEGNIGKKVFISYENGHKSHFDMTLKKPFLPSQILALISDVLKEEQKESEEVEPAIFPSETDVEAAKETPSIFPLTKEGTVGQEILDIGEENPHILDSREIEKIKDLLDMDEEIFPIEEDVPEEEAAQKKVKIITEQLMADGLEIVEEEEILSIFDSGKKPKKKERMILSKKERKAAEKAFSHALLKLKPKKIKKLLNGKKVEIVLQLKDHSNA